MSKARAINCLIIFSLIFFLSTLPIRAAIDPAVITNGINWLKTQNQSNGSYGSNDSLTIRDTSSVILALKSLNLLKHDDPKDSLSLTWLNSIDATSTDYLARKVISLANNGTDVKPYINSLLANQNEDGGFGLTEWFNSNILDTCLAVKALQSYIKTPSPLEGEGRGEGLEAYNNALQYLINRQNPDGSFSDVEEDEGSIDITSIVMEAVGTEKSPSIEALIVNAYSWLLTKMNTDGSFGDNNGSIMETSLAYIGLSQNPEFPKETADQITNYLVTAQQENGSWENMVYETSLALKTIYVSQTDLFIDKPDITLDPVSPHEGNNLSIKVMVHNSGVKAENVSVGFYEGDPANGGVIINSKQISVINKGGQQEVSLSYHTVSKIGEHNIYVTVDPYNSIPEIREDNNQSEITFKIEGSEPPNIAKILPEGLNRTPDDAPIITAEFTSEAGINIKKTKIWFDGEEVTAQAIKKLDSVSYYPTKRLVTLDHTAKVEITDVLGNTTEKDWQFTITPAIDPNIQNFKLSRNPIFEGNILNITATIYNNHPTYPANNVPVKIYLGDPSNGGIVLKSEVFSILGPEESKTISVDLDTKGRLGDNQKVCIKLEPSIDAYPDNNIKILNLDVKDSHAPDINPIPADNVKVQTTNPVIGASYIVEAGQKDILLKVDDTDVTALSRINEYSIQYQAPQSFSTYEHTAELTITDNMNRTVTKQWSFRTPAPQDVKIGDLKVSDLNPYMGNIITVTGIIQNEGTQQCLNIPYQLYLGDPANGGTPLGTVQTVAEIDPFNKKEVQFNFDTTNKLGLNDLYLHITPLQDYSTDDNLRNIQVDVKQASPVEIRNPYPVPDSTTDKPAPIIGAELSSQAGIDVNSVQISIDGVSKTQYCVINKTSVTYAPNQALSNTAHTISITAKDKLGRAETRAWSFTISAAPVPTAEIVNLMVADKNNNMIRKIDKDSNVTTYAGSRYFSLNSPHGLYASGGDIYVADTNNHRIVKRAADGTETIFAGTGIPGYQNGPVSSAQFNSPYDVYMSNGILYVADTENNAIRTIASGYVTTTGFGFYKPKGVTFSGASVGMMDVADTGHHTIKRIYGSNVYLRAGSDGSSGYVDGFGNNARFNNPIGIHVPYANASGSNEYVADNGNSRIRRLWMAGELNPSSIGVYPVNTPPLNSPQDVTGSIYDNSNVYIADTGNNLIRDIASIIAGSTTPGFADGYSGNARFNQPAGIAYESGNIYVSDTGNNAVRKIDSSYNVTTLMGIPYADGTKNLSKFNKPGGIAKDNSNNLYIADTKNNCIRKIDTSGNVTTFAGNRTAGFANGTGTSAMFNSPERIIFDPVNNLLYVADTLNYRIRKVTLSGNVTTFAGSSSYGCQNGVGSTVQFKKPEGMVLGSNNNLYVSDSECNCVKQITPSGISTTLAGNVDASGYLDDIGTNAKFNAPKGMVIDKANTFIYVADSLNDRIRKIDLYDSSVTTFAGSGNGYQEGPKDTARFNAPYDLSVDSNGNMYIVDNGNQRVRKIDNSGNVSTLAGTTDGYQDGTGSSAKFSQPASLMLMTEQATLNPDLSITSSDITTPSGYFLNASVEFTVTVRNLSGNPVFNPLIQLKDGTTVVAAKFAEGMIKAGESLSVKLTWNPSSLGSHNLTFTTDPYNSVTESNEANNTVNLNVMVTPSSDLSIISITTNPVEPSLSDTITIQAAVKNTGSTELKDINVSFMLDNNSIGNVKIDSIPANGTAPAQLTYTPTHAGNYQLKAVADDGNLIPETNENNNELTASLTIKDPINPVDPIADLSISQAELIADKTEMLIGDTSNIVAIIHNLGTADVASFKVRFYNGNPAEDGVLINEQTITGLLQNASATITLPYTPVVTGNTFIYMIIDPDNAVIESNKANNAAFIKLTTTAPSPVLPDLIVNNVTLSKSSVVTGEKVTINASISNLSAVDQINMVLKFSANGNVISETIIPKLNAGKTTTIPVEWLSYYSGTYTISATIDPANAIPEADENNNTGTTALTVTDAPKPDLSATNIRFSTSSPTEGDTMYVTVNVANSGVTADNIKVSLYNGNPLSGGSLIGTKTILTLAQGQSQDLTAIWNTAGITGIKDIYAVVDPDNAIAESDENNNTTNNVITIKEGSVALVLTADKPAYTAKEAVNISANVTVAGSTSHTGKLAITIENAGGVVETLTPISITNITGTQTFTANWNTGSTVSGSYTIKAKYSENNKPITSSQTTFTISEVKNLVAEQFLDQLFLNSYETLQIKARITAPNSNYTWQNLTVKEIIIAPDNSRINLEDQTITSLPPTEAGTANNGMELNFMFDTSNYAGGTYTVLQQVLDGTTVLATKTSNFTIAGKAVISGNISVTPKILPWGDNVEVSAKLTNNGNSNVQNVVMTVIVADPQTNTILSTQSQTIPVIDMGQSFSHSLTLNDMKLAAGSYLLILKAAYDGTEQTISTTGFELVYPDISVENVNFTPSATEGDKVNITADVSNKGAALNEPFSVNIYQEAVLIGTVTLPAINAGESKVVTALFDTTGLTGAKSISVKADESAAIPETDENNNIVTKTMDVKAGTVTPTLTLTKTEAGVKEDVGINISLTSGGTLPHAAQIKTEVLKNGNLLSLIGTQNVTVSAASPQQITQNFNTALNTASSYIIRLTYTETGLDPIVIDQPFTIKEVRNILSSVLSDKTEYLNNENVSVISNISTPDTNYTWTNVTLKETIKDASANAVFTQTKSIPSIAPESNLAETFTFNTGVYTPGIYTITQEVIADGNTVSTATKSFEIVGQPDLTSSTIAVTPPSAEIGNNIQLDYNVINSGNASLGNSLLTVTIYDLANAQVKTWTEPVSAIGISGTYVNTKLLPVDMIPGTYKVMMTLRTDLRIIGQKVFDLAQTQFNVLKPDMSVSNLIFSKSDPTEGDSITLTSTVTSSAKVENVPVHLYNGTTLLNSQVLSFLPGETKQVTYVYDTTAQVGTFDLKAIVDPSNAVEERDETNNETVKQLTIKAGIVTLNTTTNKPQYGASEDVDISLNLSATGTLLKNGTIELKITKLAPNSPSLGWEGQGEGVKTIPITNLNPKVPVTLHAVWNTGATEAGQYKVTAVFTETGKPANDAVIANFEIKEVRNMVSSTSTDSNTYEINKPIAITVNLGTPLSNYTWQNVEVSTAVTGPESIYSSSQTIAEFKPQTDKVLNFNTNSQLHKPGVYTVTTTVKHDAKVIHTSSTTFTILAMPVLSGEISVTPESVMLNETINVTYTITNSGNAPANVVSLSIPIKTESGTLLKTLTATVPSILNGTSYNNSQTVTTNFNLTADTTCNLTLNSTLNGTMKILGTTQFSIITLKLDITKKISLQPRVLVWMENRHGWHERDNAENLVRTTLDSMGVKYSIVNYKDHLTESLRSGNFNVILTFNQSQHFNNYLDREIKEMVNSKTGLITTAWHGKVWGNMLDMFGVRYWGIIPSRERTLYFKTSPISETDTLVTQGNIYRLKPVENSSAEILAAYGGPMDEDNPDENEQSVDQEESPSGDEDLGGNDPGHEDGFNEGKPDGDDGDHHNDGMWHGKNSWFFGHDWCHEPVQFPGIVANKYGQGNAMIYTFDLGRTLTDDTRDKLSDVLKRSIEYVAGDLAGKVQPKALIPVEISIKNTGTNSPTLRVEEILPTDTEIVDDADGSTSGDTITWTFTLAPDETKTITYYIQASLTGTINTTTKVLCLGNDGSYHQYKNDIPLNIPVDKDRTTSLADVKTKVNALAVDGILNKWVKKAVMFELDRLNQNYTSRKGWERNIQRCLVIVNNLAILERKDPDLQTAIADIRLDVDYLLRLNQMEWYLNPEQRRGKNRWR